MLRAAHCPLGEAVTGGDLNRQHSSAEGRGLRNKAAPPRKSQAFQLFCFSLLRGVK